MLSSSRWIASAFCFAFALSIAIPEQRLAAQGTPQDTTHKGMQMPTSMPMDKKTQKKAASGKKQMPDSAHPAHADSGHREMGDMKMEPSPARTDSTKMNGMPGM